MSFFSTLLADTMWGTINPPPGVDIYQQQVGTGEIAIILFASNIIRLVAVLAGVWSLFNLVMAGFKYITAANDVKAVETAWTSIYMSLIGLIIIVSSFTIAGIVGLIFFGDATFILNPQLSGVGP
jgi:hypothetical protein